jgi:hypothetical protein
MSRNPVTLGRSPLKTARVNQAVTLARTGVESEWLQLRPTWMMQRAFHVTAVVLITIWRRTAFPSPFGPLRRCRETTRLSQTGIRCGVCCDGPICHRLCWRSLRWEPLVPRVPVSRRRAEREDPHANWPFLRLAADLECAPQCGHLDPIGPFQAQGRRRKNGGWYDDLR